jgi:hypothetical protein
MGFAGDAEPDDDGASAGADVYRSHEPGISGPEWRAAAGGATTSWGGSTWG